MAWCPLQPHSGTSACSGSCAAGARSLIEGRCRQAISSCKHLGRKKLLLLLLCTLINHQERSLATLEPGPLGNSLPMSHGSKTSALVMAVPMSTIHIHSGRPQLPTPCLKRLRQRMMLALSKTYPISYSGLPTGMQRGLSLNPQCPVVMYTCHPRMGTG